MSDSNIKKIGCLECGKIIEVAPPDSNHIKINMEEVTNSIEMTVRCNNSGCLAERKIYWSKIRPYIIVKK